MAKRIPGTLAASKGELPFLKIARFGNARTPKGCLRHDANVTEIGGIEGDHDAGTMAPEQARDLCRAAGVAALIYTTPSHMQPGKGPRWRIWAFTSKALPPGQRANLVARLNGVVCGGLTAESFTLSQAFYAGSVIGQPPAQVWLVDGDPVDLRADLDAAAIEKPGRAESSSGDRGGLDEDAALAAIRRGATYHTSMTALAGLWSVRGVPYAESDRRLREAMEEVPDADRDERWRDRLRAISAILGAIYGKRVEEQVAREDRMQAAFDMAMMDQQIEDEETVEEAIDRLVGDPAESQPRGLTFETPDICADLALTAGRKPVIKGLVAESDVGAIIGAPGAGKSLFAPRIAFSVAQGRVAFGRKVGQGPVLYIAAEDHAGLRGRIAALRCQHGDAPDLHLVGGLSSLFPGSSDLKALRAAVKEKRPVLILIDTIAMAFPGLKENEAEHMGLVVAVARQLTTWGAAVLLVHHDTKAGDGLPRGHSILNGALDVSLHLTRDGRTVTARPTKNRNGPPDLALAFTIETMDLGTDADGDTITAAFAEDMAGEVVAMRGPKLSPSARAVYALLHRHVGPTNQMSEERLRDLCVNGREVSGSEVEKHRRDTYRRAVAEMLRKRFAVFAQGYYRLPPSSLDVTPVSSDRNEAEFSDDEALI